MSQLDDALAAAIAAIRQDREHGANELALAGARALRAVTRAGLARTGDAAAALRLLRAGCRDLARARQSMAPMTVVAAQVLLALPAGDPLVALRRADAVLRRLATALGGGHETAIARHLQRRLIADRRATTDSDRPLRLCLVTLSRSSTVRGVLDRLGADIRRLIVLESRPGGEGALAACEFAALGHGWEVQLAPDAYAAQALEEADGGVVGVDAIARGEILVNKLGTRILALAAGARRVTPVYALTSTTKIAPAAWEWQPEQADPALIVSAPIPGVSVAAPLFEADRARHYTVVSEAGVLAPDDLLARARSLDAGLRLLAANDVEGANRALDGETP